MRTFTPSVAARLDDQAAEKVRRNHDQRITELVAQAQQPPVGAYLGRQTMTGTGTYTPQSGARRAVVRMVGGGGGGGGVGTGVGVAGGGGGNSGFNIEFTAFAAAGLSGGAFSCGAGGTGGTGAPTGGGTGGDTTIVVNGKTWTAKGGTGGTGSAFAGAGVTGANTPQSGSSPESDIITCDLGGISVWYSTATWFGGQGGDSLFGRGGVAIGPVNANGNDGGVGGGGSGAVGTTGAVQSGGAGGAGAIIIDEYA